MAEEVFEEILVESMSQDEIDEAEHKKKLYEKFQDNDDEIDDKMENPIQVQSPEESQLPEQMQTFEQVWIPAEEPGPSHQNNADVDMPKIKHEDDDNPSLVINDQSIPSTSSAGIKKEAKLESQDELKQSDQKQLSRNSSGLTENAWGEDNEELVIQDDDIKEQKIEDEAIEEKVFKEQVVEIDSNEYVMEIPETDENEDYWYCYYCSCDFAAKAYLTRHQHTKKHLKALDMARNGKKLNQKVKYVRTKHVTKSQMPLKDDIRKALMVSAIKNKPGNNQTQKAPGTKQKTAIDQKDNHVVPQMNNDGDSRTTSKHDSGNGNYYDDDFTHHAKPIDPDQDSVVPSSSHHNSQDLIPSTSRQQEQNLIPSTSRQQQLNLVPSTSRQQSQSYSQFLCPLYSQFQKLQALSSCLNQLFTPAGFPSTSSQWPQNSAITSLNQKSHKPNKPYICQFCGREFVRRDYFEKHVNNHF